MTDLTSYRHTQATLDRHALALFGHSPADLDAYLRREMVKIVHRSARLRAMDRAILARDEVRERRRALLAEPLLFGEETERLVSELGDAVLTWRAAIRDMMMAKKGEL
jgi:hypothetical protein